MATTLHHWRSGELFQGTSGRFSDVTNPATGEVTAQLGPASEADVDSVVEAASAAFPRWRDTSLAQHTQILFAFRELLNARKQELAAIITAEHGKVLSDALGEVSRGQEVVEFACGIPHLVKGAFTENASSKVDVHSVRQPLGVVAIISPFNFRPWSRCGSSRSPSPGCSPTPRSSRFPSSDQPRSRNTSMRPAPRTASVSKHSAVPRTTCWCCRTPTLI